MKQHSSALTPEEEHARLQAFSEGARVWIPNECVLRWWARPTGTSHLLSPLPGMRKVTGAIERHG